MRLPHKTLERRLLKSYKNIIAVDEVGMGSLAGPVVVCAISLNRKFFQKSHKKLRWLRDSKLLSAKQRGIFVAQLFKESNLKYEISFCYPKTIDRLNIHRAARLAMKRVVLKLQAINHQLPARSIVLADGPHKIDGLKLEQIPIVKGDRKVFAIACASIIAKVTRDKMMIRYAKQYPNYGFEKHKGYGTKYHVAQLILFGPSKIHRLSFAPVTKLG